MATGVDTFEGHGDLLALDHDNPAVVDYTVDVMAHWLRRGADGWRLDAAYAVADRFWTRVLPWVREEFPDAWFVARSSTATIRRGSGRRGSTLLFTCGGTPSVYAGDEYGYRGVKEERFGGDEAVRPEFTARAADADGSSDGDVFRLHQYLVGLRRRHPWLHTARTAPLRLVDHRAALSRSTVTASYSPS